MEAATTHSSSSDEKRYAERAGSVGGWTIRHDSGGIVEYRFSQNPPISEEAALAEAATLGFYALAYDYVDVDEPLHWHEFDSVTWVIDGTGAFADEHGNVTTVTSGCRLEAPAGWLHRNLAGGRGRVVVSTNLPGHEWTTPINKDPADLPAHLQRR